MKMVACNANHLTAENSPTMDYDADNDKRTNHGFRVKGDVPCQLAYHAGFDAVDGQ